MYIPQAQQPLGLSKIFNSSVPLAWEVRSSLDEKSLISAVALWPNRLIGDQQPGAKKIAFAPNSLYKSNSPLLPSGLLGPVAVNKITAVEPGTLPE
jgi:hypothetical protein